MILHRLRLQNYRVFEELTEVEFGAGLVGIHGANGAGKSSLIGAIPWVLYGHLPTKVALARTAGTLGPCVVELEFEHEGHLYRVVREVVGDVGAPRTQAEAYVDGLQVTHGTKAVSAYMESVLGMSESAFLASVFTEQKQLAAFSARKAHERAELIVRLLGVKPLDAAIDTARADARAAEAHARQLAADVGDLGPLEDAVASAHGEAELAAAERARCERQLEEAQNRADKANAALADARAVAGELSGLRDSHTRALKELDRLGRDQVELQRELAALDRAQAELEALGDVGAALRAGERAEGAWTDFANATRRLAGSAAVEGPTVSDIERFAADAEASAAAAGAARHALEMAVSEASAAAERERQFAAMLERVGRLDVTVPCPSCGQALGDSFVENRRHFAAEHDAAMRASKAAALTAKEARAEAATLVEAERVAADTLAGGRLAAERAAALRERREADEQSARDAHAALLSAWIPDWGSLPEWPSASGSTDLESGAGAQVAALVASRVRELRRVDRRAAELGGALANRDARERQLAEAKEREATCRKDVAELERSIAALALDESAVLEATERARLAAGEVATLRRLAGGARDHAQRSQSALDTARGALAQAKELHARASEVTRKARDLARLVQLLTGFKSSVVASIGDSLAKGAAQLFAELTDGEYEDLKVDPKSYDMEIRDGGVWHPLERFSGSEQDLANLALRVAISEHVRFQSGGVVGLLVLDEVFGALDAQRREQMLVALER